MKSISPRFRLNVVDSVHRAVTDITDDDGCGHCDLYALAGTILLRGVTGAPYQIQLGSLMYLSDPDGNGWLQIDARDGGLDRQECHAWIGKPGSLITKGTGKDDPDLYSVGELIDFSVRHLRSMTERMPQIESASRVGDHILMVVKPNADRVTWTRPGDPPLYLWTTEPPSEFRYIPDMESMVSYHQMMEDNPKLIADLTKLVAYWYREQLKSL